MSSKTETPEASEEKLPALENGDIVTIVEVSIMDKKTKPPVNFTEGTLILEMEAASKYILDDPSLKFALSSVTGIGTAATRDSIIESLKTDGYITKDGKYLIPTEKGTIFIKWLNKVCPDLINVKTTAIWESKLAQVAKNGGGTIFVNSIKNEVAVLIDTMKKAPSIFKLFSDSSLTTLKKKEKTMTKPTEKQLSFALSIAQKLGIKDVPAEVREDMQACSKFIDENKDKAMRPSDKQIAYAENIAKSKGLSIPEEILQSGKALSAWIDANK